LGFCAFAQAAGMAKVQGTEWRSILPTGTQRETVRVPPFMLDRTPVTNESFLAFVRAHPQWRRDRVPSSLADSRYLSHWAGALTLGSSADPQQPVTSVSWFAASAYCESRGERLPTWYEWEVAAAADEHVRDARHRAGWQESILRWYSSPSNSRLARVGSQPANVYGIHDLHGLVWEWVEDFNALMISGDSREQGDPDILKFCGSGALSLQDRENYALAMRLALLSSLQSNATTINLGFRCASSATPAPSRTAEPRRWPADSVYQINPALQTADGRTVPFASSGRVRVATMFYASCPMACPLIVDTLRNLDAALTPSQKARVDVLMVSMDPDRDSPAALSALARERGITDRRWTLARTSLGDTRKLAAMLGIQYRKLDDGEFNHSSVLVLLDAQGRILARSRKLGMPDPAFLAEVRAAAALSSSP
jgi:formylglycine-generating enzyme required for sulfatase activity